MLTATQTTPLNLDNTASPSVEVPITMSTNRGTLFERILKFFGIQADGLLLAAVLAWVIPGGLIVFVLWWIFHKRKQTRKSGEK